MGSNMEPVPVTPQKRDPGWKHCQMFKNGDRVHLKCMYCGKTFKGGGICRFKEHLAGQTGNGVICSKVPPDVRLQMLETLKGSSVRKRKKKKLSVGDDPDYDDPGTTSGEERMINNLFGLGGDSVLLPVPEMIDDADVYGGGEYGSSSRTGGRKKSGRIRKAREVADSDNAGLVNYQDMSSKKHYDELDSNVEPVSVGSHKRDPAWRHCQMLKNGDKVHLKCNYCGKIFKGGGIYRIKEHLAGQKGNGATTCLQVGPDVRHQMQEILNSGGAKKMKRQKFSEEIPAYDYPEMTSGLEGVNNNHSGLNGNTGLLPVPVMSEGDAEVDEYREGGSSRKTGGRTKEGRVRKAPDAVNSDLVALSSKKVSNIVHMAVGRFFFDVGLSVDAVNSPFFQPMIDAISSQGLGAVGPTYHDLRGKILKNLVHEVKFDVDQSMSAWGRTGCSILVDEWNSGKGKTFVNFFVYCPEGTIFLKSADISHAMDSTDVLYELMMETVEKVGLRNVIQVVTSGEDRYVTAGKRLTDSCPTIFWTPCAGQCIDLMLEDMAELPAVKMILDQAKLITRYIYSNSEVLNMMRRYTHGVDLVDVGSSKALTNFMTLKRMTNIRQNLQSMVTSMEWVESPYSMKPEGFVILDYISSQSFWSTCGLITRLTDPLLRLSRIVGSEKMPGMGFVYGGLYRAKEAIKKEFSAEADYLVYWNIIDRRWAPLQHHPLHAAGFYFNPKFFYSLEGDASHHHQSLVFDCIEKLVSDTNIQDKIVKETPTYHGGSGDFSRKMAIRARDNLLPAEWWLTYGGGCPNLARLAIRILSQTCSLTRHKLNKRIPLEQMHEAKNVLEHQRLSDLVFVQCNISMKHMISGNKQQEAVDPIAFEHIDVFGDWVVDKELCSERGPENVNWMTVDPPLGNTMVLGQQIGDVEALGAGFDDYEIFGERI